MSSKHRVIFAVMTILGYLFVPLSSYGDEVNIHILDVGQGDSILLELPDNTKILIDGGPNGRVLDELSEVLPYWVKRIDIIMLTHSDADHVSGLVDVLRGFHVSQIYASHSTVDSAAYAAFIEEAERRQIRIAPFGQGAILRFNQGITITGLWPEINQKDVSMEGNYYSQVGLLQYGNFELLLTGDIDSEVSDKVFQNRQFHNIDVLKVPHHGSKYGIPLKDLFRLSPKASAISVGSDNPYGHPAPETISSLHNSNSNILRTDQHGRISIQVNAAGFSIYTR